MIAHTNVRVKLKSTLQVKLCNSSAGGELYSQNRENKKSFGAIYPPKDFF